MDLLIKYLVRLFKKEDNCLNIMNLRGILDCKKHSIVSSKIEDYVKGLHVNQVLDFEFFKPTESLIIIIMNHNSDILYKEKTDTDETFHIIIETMDWPNGLYLVSMNSMDGISIFGIFEVK